MTNAELIQTIRNEIEKQIKDPQEHCYGISSVNKLKELLSFLSTLESEKPMNPDELERAVVDYFEGYWPGMETAEQCNTHLHFTPPAIMRLARHFAKWGAEHASGSSEIPTNLDEAAWRYVKNKYGIYDPQKVFENEEIAEDFKAGAEWAMEQFKKVEPTNKTGWMTGDKEYVDELHFHDNALEEPFEIFIRKKDD